MAVSTLGIIPLLLFSSGFSLPLGLPPLPEDPAISRAAPAECLAYISWAGTATPDPKSENHTEKLLAEPEVQSLVASIDKAVLAGIKQEMVGRPPMANEVRSSFAEIMPDAYPLAKTILTSPAAVFLSKLEVGPQGPNFQGGAIVNVAEKAAAVKAALENLEKVVPPGMVEKVEISGASFRRIRPGPMVATWGVHGKYLIVGIGEGAAEGILERAKGQPPAWLAEVRKQLPEERLSTLMYFNVKQAIGQFAPLGGPKVKAVLDALGLENVSYLACVTGLDGKDMSAHTLVAMDGEPQGVFHLAAAKPLAAGDLAPIPRDATIAAVGRLDANSALDLLLTQVGRVEPQGRVEIKRGIAEMESELGIDVQEDVLKPLGDVWCVYNSPSEGGLLITGLTGVVQVKDHARLEATLTKLMDLFTAEVARSGAGTNGGRRRGPQIVKTTFAGHVICCLDVPTGEFPMAPAWCLTEKELIVSTFPQNIKSYLSRGKDYQSLAAEPDVAKALEGGAVAVTYCDTRKIAEFVYPLVCFGGRAIAAEASREGIPLDASMIPAATAIFPHLTPSISVVRRTSAGIEVSARGPMAGVGAGPLLLPVPWLFFSLRSADMPARPRALSMNNLKQIALAALNYESANRKLPPAFIADKATGKPLLSWRVAILPYLDEEDLYRQFHLDEPWDSAHNKPLAAHLPAVYRDPAAARATGEAFAASGVSKTAVNGREEAPGTTRYLTLRYKDGAFPGKDGLRMADITHGTSNTIMVIEADKAHAVVWTKPDDLEFNPKKPGAGLLGQPAGGFNAVFCDGAVRFIQDSIDSEVLQDLPNRHGEKSAPQ
jgi:hypothetical protein